MLNDSARSVPPVLPGSGRVTLKDDVMNVYERICLKDWHIEAENGDRQELKRGQSYTTTESKGDKVVVFSSFWVTAPINIFEPITPELP
jgi:hypothetical protein